MESTKGCEECKCCKPTEDRVEVMLKRGVLISQIFSLATLPLVLALIGHWVQSSLQNQQIERDYVSLAVSMLRSKPNDDTPSELKAWAVRLLNQNSPVPLTPNEANVLANEGLGDASVFGALGAASGIPQNSTAFMRMLNQALKERDADQVDRSTLERLQRIPTPSERPSSTK